MNDKPTKYEDLKINCPHCNKQIKFFYPIPALSQYHPDMYISQEMEYQERKQLQSNWNSLRELIEQRIYLIEPKGTCINFYCEYDSEDDYVQGMKEQARLNTLKFILDKMNELEGKDKE